MSLLLLLKFLHPWLQVTSSLIYFQLGVLVVRTENLMSPEMKYSLGGLIQAQSTVASYVAATFYMLFHSKDDRSSN